MFIKAFFPLTSTNSPPGTSQRTRASILTNQYSIRKDWKNLSSSITHYITTSGWRLTVEKGVAEILDSAGVSPASINGIIWSHHHWDHTGDPSTFPSSTSLIVGPGFKEAFTPGYPQNQTSPILESDYAGRELREISFDDDSSSSGGGVGGGGRGRGLKLGRFRAVDFFGDGSFYLLDTPGHAVGHMCGLARTTAAENEDDDTNTTFMLLGGDVAHHGGEVRPTPYLPLPRTLDPSPLPGTRPGGLCPGEVMARQHRLYPGEEAWTQPFVLPSGDAAHDLAKALQSVVGVEEFDGHPRVFTCLAHDASLVGVVGCFPHETANGWWEKGWREKSMWRWLGDYYGGVEGEHGG